MLEKQNNLEWLDFIITIALDCSDSEVNTLTKEQYKMITEKAIEKKQQYIVYLNHQSLYLSSRKKIQHLIRQHQSSLLILLDQVTAAASRVNPANTLTVSALGLTRACVYELLSFIESHFCEYLDLDERAPDAYLSYFSKVHQARVILVKNLLRERNTDPVLVSILIESLHIPASSNQIQPLCFRALFYQREVLHGVERILSVHHQRKMDEVLIELLVYLNFNSRPFMHYYTQHLATRISSVQASEDKITQLMLHYKEFNQMHRKPGVKLISSDSDVKKVISNWFTHEIGFLKEKTRWPAAPLENHAPAKKVIEPEPFKVMVLLSVDQIGLILRALDSLRILKARSMNAVFESIVPYLSTPRKTEISWDSMRSKSYSFEEKDKQVVIKVLESVISWIKEY